MTSQEFFSMESSTTSRNSSSGELYPHESSFNFGISFVDFFPEVVEPSAALRASKFEWYVAEILGWHAMTLLGDVLYNDIDCPVTV